MNSGTRVHSRHPRLDLVVAVAAVVSLAIGYVVPAIDGKVHPGLIAAGIVLLAFALTMVDGQPNRLRLAAAPWTLASAGVALCLGGSIHAGLTPLLAAGLILGNRASRQRLLSVRPGVGGIVVGGAVGAICAVVLWWAWVQPFLASTFFFPGITPATLREPWALGLTFAVVAALVNAVFEEALWRVAIVDALVGRGLRTFVAVLISASLFGLAHLVAVPSGITGVTLTFAFALLSSALIRLRNGSVVPSIIAHVVVDVVVILALS